MSETNSYNLVERYVKNVGRAIAVINDWELVGGFHKLPPNYHFTKQGQPDKRYSNYPEVQAYWDAELKQRAEWIEASQI